MPEKKHIHKLKRHKYNNGNEIFFCMLDCNYKVDAKLALGNVTLCHQCNEPFALDEYSVRKVRPHCKDCGKVAIKDENGQIRYISKRRIHFDRSIAADSTSDLRARLDGVSKGDEGDI